jgi:CDP-paratose 2-epimerase
MPKTRVLITGGAGFIGGNAAHRFMREGCEVAIWDNLSRRGNEWNLKWLREQGAFDFQKIDLRNWDTVRDESKKQRFDLILHCAGQVAVTTSVVNPRDDFESNALGTFNVLEAMRLHHPEAFLIYASTNKVYGGMEDLGVVERNGRYEYAHLAGVPETYPLDFHSPYGCSKGAADQYVRDYARIYDLATVSFRQSCIYGPRQFGVEDQGWVAWFTIAHALRRPVTIYGDGKQTRDVLFIDDLLDAYFLAFQRREKTAGEIYNIGGGPGNLLSLLELIQILNATSNRKLQYRFGDWRPGDQKVFVADIEKAREHFGWKPTHSPEAGIQKLARWVEENLELFNDIEPVAPPSRRLPTHVGSARGGKGHESK